MIEPAEFYTNPETLETNAYQAERDDRSREEISRAAVREFRDYRDALVAAGVKVTTVLGHRGSPDMVFPKLPCKVHHGFLFCGQAEIYHLFHLTFFIGSSLPG